MCSLQLWSIHDDAPIVEIEGDLSLGEADQFSPISLLCAFPYALHHKHAARGKRQ